MVREVRWEQLVQEREFRIVWQDINEHQRFSLLALWVGTICQSAERTIAKADTALRVARARWAPKG